MTAGRLIARLALALLGVWLPLTGTPAADRGIGGTGAPAAAPAISDRGIGGTGIVGVITGFGSILINGLEVAYTPTTPLTVDGVSEPGAALQVGQLAAIVANDEQGLRAASIDVRHEVSGPVTSVSADGRMLVVAGQQVAVGSDVEGLQTVHPGDWVAVSGLHQPDGVIAASRIDQRMPGTILVRGMATSGAGGWRIGDLAVEPTTSANIARGTSITARGTMENGRFSVTSVDPDVLNSNPAAFFGSHVQRMVIESYVSGVGGQVRLGRELLATRSPGVVVRAGPHRAIVQLERGARGDFVATRFRSVGRPALPRRAPFVPDRHGYLGPPHAEPHAYVPVRREWRPWQERRPGGFGRAGHWGRGPR